MKSRRPSQVLFSRKRIKAGRYMYLAGWRIFVIYQYETKWFCSECDVILFRSDKHSDCEDFLAALFDCTYAS